MTMTGSAFASGPYIALGGEVGSFQTPDPAGSYTDFTLTGRAGFDFGKYVGVEAEGAIHLGAEAAFNDTIDGGIREYSNEVTSRYGAFLRGRLPTSDNVSLFARAGLGVRGSTQVFRQAGTLAFDGSSFDDTFTRKSSDLFGAVGAGAQFTFTNDDRNALRAEYTLYDTLGLSDGESVDGVDSVVSITFVRKF